jgi:conjugal transfer/entry exclusion protein
MPADLPYRVIVGLWFSRRAAAKARAEEAAAVFLGRG